MSDTAAVLVTDAPGETVPPAAQPVQAPQLPMVQQLPANLDETSRELVPLPLSGESTRPMDWQLFVTPGCARYEQWMTLHPRQVRRAMSGIGLAAVALVSLYLGRTMLPPPPATAEAAGYSYTLPNMQALAKTPIPASIDAGNLTSFSDPKSNINLVAAEILDSLKKTGKLPGKDVLPTKSISPATLWSGKWPQDVLGVVDKGDTILTATYVGDDPSEVLYWIGVFHKNAETGEWHGYSLLRDDLAMAQVTRGLDGTISPDQIVAILDGVK